ncbi:MAG TPA: dTDP-4-dehydrorhamnose 3,5-epimerase family protein [Bryobacteraceae bacterium]|nr:dTDP-4-dehydrorhamnose 3,5-epimerase family protein [Bryobacteraceae bacterium]
MTAAGPAGDAPTQIDAGSLHCGKGIGSVIQSPDSPHLIDGVKVVPFALWPDDRGYFLEVMRMGQGAVAGFPAESMQVSAALSYPGTIKAFHYHLKQTDFWCPAQGMFQVALVDLRKGSRTYGVRNTFYVGALRPWAMMIPPGVGHGYKIIGQSAAMLVYVTDRTYDPADEGRIAFNDAGIGYDWELQHK